jgi:Aspartyl protease
VLVLGAAFSASVANAKEAFAVVPVARGFFAPVSVNGSKIMWFSVDTKALVSLISPEARRALSLPVANSGATLALLRSTGNKNAVVYAQSVKAMDMELGPGYFVEVPMTFKTERSKNARGTFEKAGLLGTDFLLKHGAVINCWTGQIFFLATQRNCR